MERHELEDRIRASLHARADDVQPTPHLWEEVSARTTRRARWHLGLWALSGAAAIVAVVFGGMLLLDNPRSVQIEPEPAAPSTAPDDTETEATEQPVPGTGPNLQVVTTDGQRLQVVDPSTGEVIRDLEPLQGFAEAGGIAEVAVRPVSDEGVLTVATVLQAEGDWNLEVSVFDAEGTRVDRQRMGMGGMDPNGPAPDVVWSEDGRYLMWAGNNAYTDGPPSGPALWAYDWVERPTDDNGLAEPFTVGAPGADAALFASGATVDLRTWTGDPTGRSTVFATSAYEAFRIDLVAGPVDCDGAEPCPPVFDVEVNPFPFEGSAPVALDTHGIGATLALVARGEAGVGAENGMLSLVVEPMSDLQRELEIPNLTPQGTAAPGDGWMAAAADRVVVGFGPEVHLLTVTGDTVEELSATDMVALPDGTVSADVVALTRGPEVPLASPTASETPTEGPAEDLPAGLANDLLPAHVVSYYPSAQEFLLEDRRTPDAPIVTWARPTGIPAELQLDEVVVWPGSTPDRLEVVTSWGQGADAQLARTVVQGGAVVSNDAFPDQYQPDSLGGSTASPVFDPNGNYLVWVESVDQPVLRALRWQNGSPSADLGRTSLDGAPPLAELTDWAVTDGGSILTAKVEDAAAPQMVEIRLLGTENEILLDGAPQVVDLPGPLVDAGSYDHPEGGDTRYVVFDDGGLRYALADGIASAIEIGDHQEPAAIRIGVFGPDSLTYQATTDGSWYRVQVDDGATSTVDAPGATMAFLPWPHQSTP